MEEDESVLQRALDAMLDHAFDQGWEDTDMDAAAERLREACGLPGETVYWDPAFGGRFVTAVETVPRMNLRH
jgi:hypothetical protein